MISLKPPPARDLPGGRLEQRKLHLLSEIAQLESPRRLAPRWKFRWRSPGFAVAVATIVVVLGVVVLTTQWGATEASAAQVRASIVGGLGVPRSIAGEFVVESRPARPAPKRTRGCSNCKPPLPTPSAFVLGADGSFSMRALTPNSDTSPSAAYDATTNVATQSGGQLGYLRLTGINPAFTTFRPESALATWVLYALQSGDSHVTSTTFQGRDAWALTLRFTPGDDYYDTYGARVDVVVDKETGLLLKLTQYENDANYWTSIETIRNLRLDGPTSPSDFTLPVPPSAKVTTHDLGFRPVTAAQAATTVGYTPLLPADTGGRPLARLAVAKKSPPVFVSTGSGPVIFRDAVSARYGTGLNAITVSTRRGQPYDSAPSLTAHTITVEHGPLKGATAYLSNSPTVPGFLSTYYKGLVIEITAPSADEALATTESLSRG